MRLVAMVAALTLAAAAPGFIGGVPDERVVLALTATALATRAVRRTRHGPPDRTSSPRR